LDHFRALQHWNKNEYIHKGRITGVHITAGHHTWLPWKQQKRVQTMQTDYRSLGCLINPPEAETVVALEIRNKDRFLDGETVFHKRFCLARSPKRLQPSRIWRRVDCQRGLLRQQVHSKHQYLWNKIQSVIYDGYCEEILVSNTGLLAALITTA
jgi:hypothetical protein